MNRFLSMIPAIAAMLRKQKFINLLLLGQVAVLTAVVVNALAVVSSTQERWGTATGVDEGNIGVIRSIGVIGAPNTASAAQNLQLLREIPGVESAAYGAPPFMNTDTLAVRSRDDIRASTTDAYLFQGSQGLARTLGVQVVAGRSFDANDPPPAATLEGDTILPVLVTEALSKRLYPGTGALGKVMYSDGNPLRVIGIIRHLRAQISGAGNDDLGIVSEVRIDSENVGGAFTIRTREGHLNRVLPLAAAAMEQHNPGHVQADVFTLSGKRHEYFSSDVAVTRMLLSVVIVLLITLGLGLAGLTHFLIQKRGRQIGVLRAMGAMRRDVLFYFAFENFLVAGSGIVLGLLLAMFINRELAEHYGLSALPFGLAGATAAGMLAISLAAVMLTVRRVNHVEPVVLLG